MQEISGKRMEYVFNDYHEGCFKSLNRGMADEIIFTLYFSTMKTSIN